MAGQRQQQSTRLEIAPGIFTEATDSGAPGRWKDGDGVRFTHGYPEKMGGWVRQTLSFADGVSTEILGHVRAVLDWTAHDQTRLVAIGTECKLYLIANLTVHDITPIRRQVYLTDPFATVSGSRRIVVSDASFGSQQFDYVTFTGATAVGGVTIAGEYQIVEVIDANTYAIEHSTAASSSTTGGGNVTAQYQISCGPADDGTILTGFGTGDYGMEDYGNAMDLTSTFVGNARLWSLQKFGEDLLAAPRGQALFWWDRSNGVNSRAQRVQGAPNNIGRLLVSPNERYAIALATNEITSENVDKMLIRWCDTNDFSEWYPALIPTDESFAGFRRPAVGNEMITGLRTDALMLVWSDTAMYRMLPVGEPDVFEVQQVGEEVRIMGPNCAVEIDGTVIFMGRDSFHIYDGKLDILPCDIWTYVFRDVNRDQASKFYAWVNTTFSEVWFHYCSEGSNENDRVAIYNYKLRCWYHLTVARECGHSIGAFGYPYAFMGGELYLHEHGYNDGEDFPLWAWIESYDAEIAQGSYNLLVTECEPDMDHLSGDVDLFFRAKERLNSPDAVEDGPYTVNAYTHLVHPRLRGSTVALRIESSDLDSFWRAGPPRVKFGPYGRR